MLIEDEFLRNRLHVFRDRDDAGIRLAGHLMDFEGTDAIVMAIPSGGVPVSVAISRTVGIPLELVVTRKVQIPWNTEAGFGAVNPDGDVVLNDDLISSLNLSGSAVEEQIRRALDTVRKRERLFRKDQSFPEIRDRTVIVADDGLASGYTMRAALGFLRKRNPHRVVVAVPTGSDAAVQRLLPDVDTLICLNVREGYPYAVADAYRNWHDITDNDVLRILDQGEPTSRRIS